METPPLSIIIATRDRGDSLARLARSLAAVSGEWPGAEIIAVNDGGARRSESSFRSELARSGWRVQFLHAEHGGPAAARNAALEAAGAPLLLFLDDDSVMLAGTLTALRRMHVAHPGDVLICNSRWASREPRSDAHHALAARRHCWVGWEDGEPMSLDALEPCGWLAPTAMLRAAGGFRAELTTPPLETWELGWRLSARGAVARFVRDAIVEHEMPESVAAVLQRRHRMGRELTKLAASYPGEVGLITSEAREAIGRSGFSFRWRRRLALREEFADHGSRWGWALLRGHENLPLEGWMLPVELPRS